MTRDSVRRTSDLVQVGFGEIGIDVRQACFWIASCLSTIRPEGLWALGHASGTSRSQENVVRCAGENLQNTCIRNQRAYTITDPARALRLVDSAPAIRWQVKGTGEAHIHTRKSD